jgi:hypothetical protein
MNRILIFLTRSDIEFSFTQVIAFAKIELAKHSQIQEILEFALIEIKVTYILEGYRRLKSELKAVAKNLNQE